MVKEPVAGGLEDVAAMRREMRCHHRSTNAFVEAVNALPGNTDKISGLEEEPETVLRRLLDGEGADEVSDEPEGEEAES